MDSNHDLIRELSYFEGNILGDLCLLYNNKKHNPSYVTGVFYNTHKDYMEWQANNRLLFKDRPIWTKSYYDKRTQKTYSSYWMKTDPSWKNIVTNYQANWYYTGTKQVPHNFQLQKESLLTWYLDDGSVGSKKGIYLATDSFNQNSLDNLITQLDSIINCKVSLHKNGNGKRIYIPTKNASSLLEYIGDCPVLSYSYKWNIN
jgi:hypothetical protein